MGKKFEFRQYVDYKVYSVTTIKKGYGFRVSLIFADDTTTTQQHSGYKTKREQIRQGMRLLDNSMTEPILYMGRLK